MATEQHWAAFWNKKAGETTDFQATGRGRMDVVGFLYTVRECARILDLQPSDNVLDIGCGTGIFALALSPFVRSIVAYDISSQAVQRAKNNLSDADNVVVDVGSITSLPCTADRFDKVLAYSVLQYLGSEDAVLAAFTEIARALRPSGVGLLAGNPDPQRRKMVEDEILSGPDEAVAQKSLAILADTLWLSREKMIELAERAGLQARVVAISPRIQQHTYMFDIVVKKQGAMP